MWRQLLKEWLRFQPLVSMFQSRTYSGGKKSQRQGRIFFTSAWSAREYITGICRFLSLMFQFYIAVYHVSLIFPHQHQAHSSLLVEMSQRRQGDKSRKIKTWYFHQTRPWMMAATRNILASSQIKRLLPCNVFIPLKRNSLMPVIQSSIRKGRIQHML